VLALGIYVNALVVSTKKESNSSLDSGRLTVSIHKTKILCLELAFSCRSKEVKIVEMGNTKNTAASGVLQFKERHPSYLPLSTSKPHHFSIMIHQCIHSNH
jgi:hypothetical protein